MIRSKSGAAPKQVRVLQKTLDILETIKKERSGIGLAEVSRSVSMPKATVYRILTTLEINGYLDRLTDGGYRMSDKLFSLQRDLSPAQNLLRVAHPIMEELAKECRETVNLGTMDGGEVVVIATVESPNSVRMSSKVGNRRCFHTTGLGKVLLASMADQSIRRLVQLKGLPRLTPKSLTTQTALLAEIHQVRKQGYAVDNQENELEGRCIAMAIAGVKDMPAALSISSPVFRMDKRRLRSFVPLLRKGCEEIARAFGE
jgi:DNA-binding IclR family transcriptional regulator